MVISGMRTGKNKSNGVISVGSTSGTSNSLPTQSRHHSQLDRNNFVTMRSGREIIRQVGADTVLRNGENGSLSRKRHWQQKPSIFLNNRPRKIPKIAIKGRRRDTLSSRSYREDEEEVSEAFSGKRSILFWLIDSGMVPLDARVCYANMSCTATLMEGKVTKDGLLCKCCNSVVTVSEFEAHAGSKLNDPYRNIFLETGINLLNCQIGAWNRQDESARCSYRIIESHENDSDENDDTCGTCGDGGELICCDGCPSTYHQSCMDIEVLPQGDWICPNCLCKFCRRFKYEPAGPLNTCHLFQTLHFLGVEKLIIPSIEERVDKWINGYGFQPIEEALRQEMRSMNLLTFPETIMLQKNLMPRCQEEIRKANADLGHKPAPFDLNLLPPDSTQEDDMA